MAKVAVEIDSVRNCQFNDKWTVILVNKPSGQFLPIYIGSVQAEIIKGELTTGLRYPLPEDYSSSSVGLDDSNDLVSVTVNRFEDNIFYARLLLTRDDKFFEVYFPCAKAIALALRRCVPIFVEESVLSEAAIKIISE